MSCPSVCRADEAQVVLMTKIRSRSPVSRWAEQADEALAAARALPAGPDRANALIRVGLLRQISELDKQLQILTTKVRGKSPCRTRRKSSCPSLTGAPQGDVEKPTNG